MTKNTIESAAADSDTKLKAALSSELGYETNEAPEFHGDKDEFALLKAQVEDLKDHVKIGEELEKSLKDNPFSHISFEELNSRSWDFEDIISNFSTNSKT